MVLFLLLHVFGLGTVIVASVVYGMWDLALINGLVFLVLLRLEMVLCAKRYTVPLPVYADGTVGTAAVEKPREAETVEPEEESVELTQPVELAEPQITPNFEVVAA